MEELFPEGELLLGTAPSEGLGAPSAGLPLSGELMAVLCILLFLLCLGRFINILPYIFDSILRARGSAALENSVRVREDRNIIAYILLIPACLVLYRYRIYDPAFLQDLPANYRMLGVAGILLAMLLLRLLLYRWMMPRRRYELYQVAYRAGHTFFILLMMLVLPTIGLLYVFHASDLTVRTVVVVESALSFLLYLLRKGEILSGFCNPLTTFLYLCALELLPLGLYVASALCL